MEARIQRNNEALPSPRTDTDESLPDPKIVTVLGGTIAAGLETAESVNFAKIAEDYELVKSVVRERNLLAKITLLSAALKPAGAVDTLIRATKKGIYNRTRWMVPSSLDFE